MDYADYIRSISFHSIQPDTRLTPEDLLSWLENADSQFLDISNTRIPWREPELKPSLREICRVPRMSTFAIAAMINYGVSQMSESHAFVNVGVWHGFTLLAGMCDNPEKICIGIDNFSQFKEEGYANPRESFLERFNRYRSPHHHFYEMDYREYFSRIHRGLIGFYLYDGDHEYDHQLQGLLVAEPFFAEDCIILVDDTNSEAPRQATLDFVSQSLSSYRILLDRKTCSNWHPTLWNGVMVLQKMPGSKAGEKPCV